MIKKSVVDQIGKMDEIFGMGGNDDLDWSIAIRKAGYNLKVLRDVFIHHEGFQSLGMVFKDYKEIEDITRPLLIKKWGNDTVEELFKVDENFLVTGKEKEKL
jgi:O-antigen biosynthesis protein